MSPEAEEAKRLCEPKKYEVIHGVKHTQSEHLGKYWFATTKDMKVIVGTSRITEDEAWLDALVHATVGVLSP